MCVCAASDMKTYGFKSKVKVFHIYIYRERISDRDKSLSLSLSQTQICLSQTQISLSQTQLRQLACPKSIKNVTNGVPMAPFGLKLSQNESYGLQGPFKTPPGPP